MEKAGGGEWGEQGEASGENAEVSRVSAEVNLLR